jgi:hypothetical protein
MFFNLRSHKLMFPGFVNAALVITMVFMAAVGLTMCLVPQFELSLAWGWIPVWSHRHSAGLDAGYRDNYREDPL